MKRNLVFFSFLLLVFISTAPAQARDLPKTSGSSAILTQQTLSVEAANVAMDRRVKVLKEFLTLYKSPLAPFAKQVVETADSYRLDWRLLVAISGVESTFCREIPYNSCNCWGWGIYGNNAVYFQSHDEAITTISRGLRKDYMDGWGATNVYEIGRFYATSPTWANRVTHFMNKIDEFETRNPNLTLSISI